MKNLIFILFVLFISCSDQVNEDLSENKNDFVSELSKKNIKASQNFVISTEKDTIIEGDEGTIIYVPSNCFRQANGTSVSGKVSFKLIEFYKKSDLIINEISTTSNQLVLNSGGMLHISANQQGSQVFLKEKIFVLFPKAEKKKRKQMFTFYAKDTASTFNWELDSNILVDPDIKIIHSEGTFTLKDEKVDIKTYLQNSELFTEKIKREVLRYSIINNSPLELTIKIDEEGYTENVSITKGISRSIDNEIKDFLYKTPPYKRKTRKGYFIPDTFKVYIGAIPKSASHLTDTAFNKAFVKKYKNRFLSIEKAELDYYILSANKLGWVNCDEFVNYNNKVEFDVYTNQKNATVRLILNDLKSIVQATKIGDGKYHFKNIPSQLQATLLAISYTDSISIANKPVYIDSTTNKISLDLTRVNSLDELHNLIEIEF